MTGKRILGGAFIVAGTISLFLAVFAAIGTAIALSDRIRFGPGLMFADVEFLAMLTFLLGGAGAGLLWLGRRLVRLNGSSWPEEK